MGMIRVDKTSAMKDVVLPGLRRDPGFAGDRTLAAAGHECRDPRIDTVVELDQAPDSSRSRGYGQYEI